MEYLGLIISALFAFLFYFQGKLLIKDKTLKLITTFSGAYLLGITFLHIIPEIFGHVDHNHNHNSGFNIGIGFWIFIGFFLQLLLDYWSKGIEHGHAHGKIGFGVVLALSIHSFLEAMPLLSNHGHQHSHMLLGIIFHKIPVAVVLASILNKQPSKYNVWWILLFVISAPIGLFLGSNLEFIGLFHKELLAIVVGLLLHIATTILFESTSNHTFNRKKLLIIAFGFLLAFVFSSF
jgi:hypothetical protein